MPGDETGAAPSLLPKKMEFQACLELGEWFFFLFSPHISRKKGLSPKTDIFLLFFSLFIPLPPGFWVVFSPLMLICQCCLVFFNLIYSIFVYLLWGIKGCVRFGREKKGEIKKKKNTSDAPLLPLSWIYGEFVGFWIKRCAFWFSKILCFPTGSQRLKEFGGQKEGVSPRF